MRPNQHRNTHRITLSYTDTHRQYFSLLRRMYNDPHLSDPFAAMEQRMSQMMGGGMLGGFGFGGGDPFGGMSSSSMQMMSSSSDGASGGPGFRSSSSTMVFSSKMGPDGQMHTERYECCWRMTSTVHVQCFLACGHAYSLRVPERNKFSPRGRIFLVPQSNHLFPSSPTGIPPQRFVTGRRTRSNSSRRILIPLPAWTR